MNRRGFLASVGAACAATSLPALAAHRTFYIDSDGPIVEQAMRAVRELRDGDFVEYRGGPQNGARYRVETEVTSYGTRALLFHPL